jgi:hypothetical protein
MGLLFSAAVAKQSIAASFYLLSKFTCRLSTIHFYPQTNNFLIELPLQKILLFDKDKPRYRNCLTNENLKYSLAFD